MLSDLQIQAAYLAGQAAHPGVLLSVEFFALMAREREVETENLENAAGDFYLTCAAGQGDAEAIRAIEVQFVPHLTKRLMRLGSPRDSVPDILQAIRERLFAGPKPRIWTYNATGPVGPWIRVVAIRLAIDLHRLEEAMPRDEVALSELVAFCGPDATALVMKSEYKWEFEEALHHELSGLSSRDRTVLRLHVVEGVSIEKIAVMYGVHRVTVARWVWTAGETVLDGLRRHFQERLGVTPQDFDSLAKLVRSQLSLRLDQVLGETSDSEMAAAAGMGAKIGLHKTTA